MYPRLTLFVEQSKRVKVNNCISIELNFFCGILELSFMFHFVLNSILNHLNMHLNSHTFKGDCCFHGNVDYVRALLLSVLHYVYVNYPYNNYN